MADVKAIAETLVNLTVKEVSELAKVLKDEYGIEPAAAAASVAGPGAGAPAAAEKRHSMLFSKQLADRSFKLLKRLKTQQDLDLKKQKILLMVLQSQSKKVSAKKMPSL